MSKTFHYVPVHTFKCYKLSRPYNPNKRSPDLLTIKHTLSWHTYLEPNTNATTFQNDWTASCYTLTYVNNNFAQLKTSLSSKDIQSTLFLGATKDPTTIIGCQHQVRWQPGLSKLEPVAWSIFTDFPRIWIRVP